MTTKLIKHLEAIPSRQLELESLRRAIIRHGENIIKMRVSLEIAEINQRNRIKEHARQHTMPKTSPSPRGRGPG